MRAPVRVAAILAALAAVACGDPRASDDPDKLRSDTSEETSPPAPLDALSRRFGRVRSELRDRGYREVRLLPRQFALDGSGVALPLDLPTGRCTTVAALGSGGLRNLDLILYDGSGVEVAFDAVEREGGLVHACPQGDASTAPHHLVMAAAAGSGAISAALFESQPGTGEGFEGLFDSVLAPQVPFQDVEERLARSRTALRERGLVQLRDPRVDVVAEGEVLREPIGLEKGRCYVAVAASGEGLTDVDLFLYDPQGAEVDRNLESDAEPSLEHCPEQGGRHIFEVRAFEGAGALGLVIMVGPAPDEHPGDGGTPHEGKAAEPVPDSDPVAALGNVTAGLAGRGYEPVFVLRESSLMPGEVRSHQVLLGPGCGVVVGAASRAGMDLDLYLSDASGQAVDRDARVEPTARVLACPEEAAVMRVTVKGYGREAPYALTVMRAPPDIGDVQSLRLEEADAAFRARGYERVRTFRAGLGEGEHLRRSLEIQPGRCVAIAAAGDAGVEDLDLFLRSPDGQLVASASGQAPWAAVSRCAEEASELLELDAVMYRGSGEVAFVRLEAQP